MYICSEVVVFLILDTKTIFTTELVYLTCDFFIAIFWPKSYVVQNQGEYRSAHA